MRNNYRKIGDFITRISVKNTDGNLDLLLGIKIDKYFMPSVANVVGTDLSKYKVVKPNQFSCNRMHVGRDERLPVAFSKFDYNFIVSPAYDVFEVTNTNELNPEYLMMWFSRKEFDRNCWFHTDTDVRGKLGWDSLCDIKLPIPNLQKQQGIVNEYNTIVNRIKLNEQLNQKLEETAQALYKHWFVDFEFPYDFAQGKPNKDGKPYKSNGGKMVFNAELEKEIPVGWEVGTVKSFTNNMKSGGTPNRSTDEYWSSKDVPWLKTGELKNRVVIDAEEYISALGLKNSSAKLLPKNSVLIAMYGQGETKGQIGYLKIPSTTNQACCSMICENENRATYLYYYLRINRIDIVSVANGGAQPNLSKEIIENLILLEPSKSILESHPFVEIMNHRESITRESQKLTRLKILLLSKMSKTEELVYD